MRELLRLTSADLSHPAHLFTNSDEVVLQDVKLCLNNDLYSFQTNLEGVSHCLNTFPGRCLVLALFTCYAVVLLNRYKQRMGCESASQSVGLWPDRDEFQACDAGHC